MGQNSGVAWCDHSWGPWRGCRKVTTECQNCYAEREQTRYGRDHSVVVRAAKATFEGPLKWPAGRVFVCPWSDFWIEDADEWRVDAYDVMRRRPDHTWIIPTKRPENVLVRLPEDWGNGWPNAWGLVSAGTQATADLFVPQLMRLPFAVRGISMEPLLGDVDLVACGAILNGVYPSTIWIVVGCESAAGGKVGRLSTDEWGTERGWRVRCGEIVEQAVRAGVKVFVKQIPINGRVSHDPAEWPEGLRLQEYPT